MLWAVGLLGHVLHGEGFSKGGVGEFLSPARAAYFCQSVVWAWDGCVSCHAVDLGLVGKGVRPIPIKVGYQAAKTAFWKGQAEKGREAQSLEELLEGRR